MDIPLQKPPGWSWAKTGLFGKLIGIGFLALLLLIPLQMVNGLRLERERLRDSALEELGRMWGGEQRLLGPVLVVPYLYRVDLPGAPDAKGESRTLQTRRASAYFFPETLRIEGSMEPELRSRGIYQAVLYSARMRIEGSFARPDWRFLAKEPSEILWGEARVIMAVSDARGLREVQPLTWREGKAAWGPGTRWSEWKTGLQAFAVGMDAQRESSPFAVELTLNGSRKFSVIPGGKASEVRLRSAWPDPSFSGSYLPTERKVGADGFRASWQISHLGRSLPQQWSDAPGENTLGAEELADCTVGVNLVKAVDVYRTTDRAIKHGLLFLVLVFVAFFVFELSGSIRLSVLHYLLVGAALALFYLGLLSLSEFIGFGLAYWVSASASSGMIAVYCHSIPGKAWRALLITLMLGFVYGCLYFVLHMQDYALLAGSAALFAALGAVMWVTRRWERKLED